MHVVSYVQVLIMLINNKKLYKLKQISYSIGRTFSTVTFNGCAMIQHDGPIEEFLAAVTDPFFFDS